MPSQQNSETLYVSTPLINIDGADETLMENLRRDVMQICIEESLDLPSMFTLVINNPYIALNLEDQEKPQPWYYDPVIKMGTVVKLGFTASTTEFDTDAPSDDSIIVGEITAIETNFTKATQAPILIRGYDVSHRLHRGRHNRSFQNKTDSDLVKELSAEVGIEATDDTVKPSDLVHDYLFQENQTNMEFLRERAARIGFELFVQDEKMHFRPPTEGEVLELLWLTDIESFRVRVASAEQVEAVEVRGWDYRRQAKQEIVESEPQAGSAQGQGGLDVITETKFEPTTQFGDSSPPPKLLVVDKPVFSNEEAKRLAEALWSEIGGEFVQADARAYGNPEIRVGKVVDLVGMGRYDGRYYITETRHLYHEGIYTTEFCIRGLRGGALLNLLTSRHTLKPSQTLMIGIVTHNHDPEGLGRVRVRFPTLTPERDGSAHSSDWARIVSVGAGDQRGFDWIPEINDEVLVGFEHGDIRRPYILGGLWNGKNKRVETVEDTVPKEGANRGKVRLRTLTTRTGHTLQFVEEDQGDTKAGVTLTTSKGHQLQLNDSDRDVTLTTARGQQVRLSDADGAITIDAKGPIVLDPGFGQPVVISGSLIVSGTILATHVDSTPLAAVKAAAVIASLSKPGQTAPPAPFSASVNGRQP